MADFNPIIERLQQEGVSFEAAVKEFKRVYVRRVLIECRANQCKAAGRLGIHRNTMSRYMDDLGIKRPRGCA